MVKFLSSLTFLTVFAVFVNAQYPITYGCMAQILAYSPMKKLYNAGLFFSGRKTREKFGHGKLCVSHSLKKCVRFFVENFETQIVSFQFVNALNNKDTTLAARKSRANTWVPKNMGSHLFPKLDIYSSETKAVSAVLSLLDHRNTVGLFWNDLLPQLQSVYNKTTANQYKAMWAKTDKAYDNAFFDALNEWYAYCHYHSPTAKRNALYKAIQTVTAKYTNNTSLNYEPLGSAYNLGFFLMALMGMW